MTTAAAATTSAAAAAHYRPRLPHERLVEKILQVEAKLKEMSGIHHYHHQQQQQASQTINDGITLDHSSASTTGRTAQQLVVSAVSGDININNNNKRSTTSSSSSCNGRKRTSSSKSTVMTDDDNNNNNTDDDAATHYRKTLGPLRFAFCESFRHHAFDAGAKKASSSQKQQQQQQQQSTTPKLHANMRALFTELSSYSTALPVEFGSSIFLRANEDNLNLLRALIVGPDDTPYANGCFVFDIRLHDGKKGGDCYSYPHKPPQVKFVTTGNGRVTFNPNLYANGKVCLSLLGTWDGPGWVDGTSTLLQVLVSLQSLVFVKEPFYNEPLFGSMSSSWASRLLKGKSAAYNANIRRHVLQHAMLPFLKNPHASGANSASAAEEYPEFDQVIQQHFACKRQHIQHQVQQWMVDDPTLEPIVQQVLAKLKRRRSKLDKTSLRVAVSLTLSGKKNRHANGDESDEHGRAEGAAPLQKKQKTTVVTATVAPTIGTQAQH